MEESHPFTERANKGVKGHKAKDSKRDFYKIKKEGAEGEGKEEDAKHKNKNKLNMK